MKVKIKRAEEYQVYHLFNRTMSTRQNVIGTHVVVVFFASEKYEEQCFCLYILVSWLVFSVFLRPHTRTTYVDKNASKHYSWESRESISIFFTGKNVVEMKMKFVMRTRMFYVYSVFFKWNVSYFQWSCPSVLLMITQHCI